MLDFDRSKLLGLVAKYQGSGPRYTSYPTALEFGAQVNAELWRECLLADFDARPASHSSLYLHAPFCRSLCYFCACSKVIDPKLSQLEAFMESVCRELDAYRELIPAGNEAVQIHWGGGSPSFLPADAIDRLCDKIDQVLPSRAAGADISVEVDPRTSSPKQLEHLYARGFNRLSIGVQDFDPSVQRIINRNQSIEQTEEIYQAARAIGFRGINFDLIYGLPGQTAESFRSTVDAVISLRPDRIALYGYAHVTWLKKVQKAMERVHIPTSAERLDLFLHAMERLCDSGYEYVGLDHFATEDDELSAALRSGRLNRNFMGYSTHKGVRIIGVGPSAISSVPGAMAQNLKALGPYCEALTPKGGSADSSAVERGVILSQDDLIRADVIHDIMCSSVIEVAAFEEKWSIDFWEYFAEVRAALAAMEADGLLRSGDGTLRLSFLGRVFARNIAMLFDAYLPKHGASRAPAFSQTV